MSSAADAFAWYSLMRTPGIGAKTAHAIHGILSRHGLNITDITGDHLCQSILELRKFEQQLRRLDQTMKSDQIVVEYDRIVASPIETIFLGSPLYPTMLAKRLGTDSPPVIFAKGLTSLLSSGGAAIVGSRAPSAAALELARRVSHELALAEMNVISGYAGGIDTEAHLGALEAEGTTMMILSAGIYEFSRKRVFNHVRWDGNILAVSQFLPIERWSARNAMTRNRVVCALAEAVLVVESGVHKPGKMSGTLDAGLQALSLGIPLFVVHPDALPGKPAGNAELIVRGGIPVWPDEISMRILSHESVRCVPQATQPHEEAAQLSFLSDD